MANSRRLKTAKEPVRTEMTLRDVFAEFDFRDRVHYNTVYRMAGALGNLRFDDKVFPLPILDHAITLISKPEQDRDYYDVTVTVKTFSNSFPVLLENCLDYVVFGFKCVGDALCIRTENDTW